MVFLVDSSRTSREMDSPFLLRRIHQLPLTSACSFLLGTVLTSDRLFGEVHIKWVVIKGNKITLTYINVTSISFF